ncbi:hypothetical protein HZA97_06065 [Candidatus Woesearchaeota archaeon]|nr:hypothetical protein [Candidatus Woesearchaeota archaeon]
MSFEIKDPTFSWVEWSCLFFFTLGLIISVFSSNELNRLLLSFIFGLFGGKLIYRWDKKAKLVGVLAVVCGALGLLIASFNVLTVVLLFFGTHIAYTLHKENKIESIDF